MSSYVKWSCAGSLILLLGFLVSVSMANLAERPVAVADTIAADGSATDSHQTTKGHPVASDGLLTRVQILEECCIALKSENESLKKEIELIKNGKLSIDQLQSLEIMNIGSGKVLDVPCDKLGQNGIFIQQFDSNSGPHQRWRLNKK